MKPYLKAEMLYDLRVLLSIVDEANSGVLSKENALKKLKEVKFVGDLTGNHLFAVGVLRGLIVHREFLISPIVATTLCNAVRKGLFHGDMGMSNNRIQKATKMASESLGLHMLCGEHALCESVRATKGNSPGNDAFHKDQDFVWASSEYNVDNKIITEIRPGKKPIYHEEYQDRTAFKRLG